jgi:Ca-activated chloride channel family protein
MAIDLSGTVNSKEEKFQFNVDLVPQSDNSDMKFVAQMWASRRIGEIIDLIDLNGKNPELINELVELSKKWGIVTPYTSYLADDQADFRRLASRESSRADAFRRLDILNEEAGESAFNSRAQKQLYKASDLATPQANQALSESRGLGSGFGSASGAGPGGMAGGGQRARPNQAGQNKPPAGMRQVGSVTIYVRGKTLIADNAADVELENNSAVIELKRFSDKYFELVTSNTAEENLILSQQQDDETLVVKLRDKVYKIN